MMLTSGRGWNNGMRGAIDLRRKNGGELVRSPPSRLNVELEGQLQSKFEHARRTQAVNARADAHALSGLLRVIRPVQAARLTVQDTADQLAGPVEVGEVEGIK